MSDDVDKGSSYFRRQKFPCAPSSQGLLCANLCRLLAGCPTVAAPHLLRGEAIPKFAGLMMSPALVLGPSMVGILLTRAVEGTSGLRDLFSRMRRVHFPARWYAALPIAPVLVLIT